MWLRREHDNRKIPNRWLGTEGRVQREEESSNIPLCRRENFKPTVEVLKKVKQRKGKTRTDKYPNLYIDLYIYVYSEPEDTPAQTVFVVTGSVSISQWVTLPPAQESYWSLLA